jgi:glycosyltransferase involved in cell wall biosynthesis
MTTLLMTADTVGGVWTYALELARALGDRGVRVELATMGAPLDAAQGEAVGRLANVHLHASSYKLEWMDEPWEDVHRAGEWLLRLERELRPDVVHLNGYVHAALPWRAPAVVVGHSCVLSWWRAVKGESAPAVWARYQREVARGLQAANMVVAPSRAMLDALQAYYGPLRRTAVVYNGRDARAFPPAAKERFAFSAGRLWDEAKNVRALADAAPRLSWPVYVAGEERHPSGERVPVGGVHALGRLAAPELAGWLARASVYALPARYEPFGLSALEAALAGCALVLGDIPSLREVWGDAAVFVPPDDARALARALGALIDDDRRREALAARARRRALRYTRRRMAAGYLAAYAAAREVAGARAEHARSATAALAPRLSALSP